MNQSNYIMYNLPLIYIIAMNLKIHLALKLYKLLVLYVNEISTEALSLQAGFQLLSKRPPWHWKACRIWENCCAERSWALYYFCHLSFVFSMLVVPTNHCITQEQPHLFSKMSSLEWSLVQITSGLMLIRVSPWVFVDWRKQRNKK
jgi:hypothetical protein